MRVLPTLILPALALAQGTVVGNPTGSVLGIFAMCGTNPVDCANGWCCLTGQICTNGPKGSNTACIDPSFTNGNANGVTVNAAYFGKMLSTQVTGTNGSVPGHTTIQQQTVSASSQVVPTTMYAILSAAVGAAVLLF